MKDRNDNRSGVFLGFFVLFSASMGFYQGNRAFFPPMNAGKGHLDIHILASCPFFFFLSEMRTGQIN